MGSVRSLMDEPSRKVPPALLIAALVVVVALVWFIYDRANQDDGRFDPDLVEMFDER